MVFHSHHVKSNKSQVSSRSSPRFIVVHFLYRKCFLSDMWLTYIRSGNFRSHSGWTLTFWLDPHLELWEARLKQGWGPLLCRLCVSGAGGRDSWGQVEGLTEELTRTDCYWAGFCLLEQLPHGTTTTLFPNYLLPLLLFPRSPGVWLVIFSNCLFLLSGLTYGVIFKSPQNIFCSKVLCPLSDI